MASQTKSRLAASFNDKNFITLLMFGIAGIVVVGIFLYFLGFIFPSLAAIKVGKSLFIALAGVAVFTIAKFVIDRSFTRSDVLWLIMVVGLIAGFIYLAPTYLPEFFSLLPIN